MLLLLSLLIPCISPLCCGLIFVVRPVWSLLLPLKSFESQRSRFHSSLKRWRTVFCCFKSWNLHSAETWKYLALFLMKTAVWWVVWRFLRYVNIIPCYKLLCIPSSCVLMQNMTVNSGSLDLFSGLGCSHIQRGAECQCFWDVASTAQQWCRCKTRRPMSDLRSLHSSVIRIGAEGSLLKCVFTLNWLRITKITSCGGHFCTSAVTSSQFFKSSSSVCAVQMGLRGSRRH